MIVENRIGAAGMIAANAVAKAAPDGRMMLVSTSGEIAISQHLYKEKMSYDPLKDLAPITLIGIVPNVVIVSASTPVHNPKELVAYIKANEGKMSYLVIRHRQSAAALRRADEHHGGHARAARAVPRRGALGDRGRDRRRHHELHEPRRRAGPDPGRQGSRRRRHLARPHAATARRRAAAERFARS